MNVLTQIMLKQAGKRTNDERTSRLKQSQEHIRPVKRLRDDCNSLPWQFKPHYHVKPQTSVEVRANDCGVELSALATVGCGSKKSETDCLDVLISHCLQDRSLLVLTVWRLSP